LKTLLFLFFLVTAKRGMRGSVVLGSVAAIAALSFALQCCTAALMITSLIVVEEYSAHLCVHRSLNEAMPVMSGVCNSALFPETASWHRMALD
jgi:hypothetical protein